jgi:SNF2 family DNA or RNA helicase
MVFTCHKLCDEQQNSMKIAMELLAVTVANQMPSLLFFQFTTICKLVMSINHMVYFV